LIKGNGEAIIRSSLELEGNDDRTTKNQPD
jgi:hypothetical protein